MSDIFDEIFNIPEGLVLTDRQKKGLDKLDLPNRLMMIRRYKAQQGIDHVARAAKKVYDVGEEIGEFVADAQIAKYYKDEMEKTGARLVNKYGKGQGVDIDNYYHPLLQCQLAKISETSRKNGIRLGYAKEVYDLGKKIARGDDVIGVVEDSLKDLKNNELGSILGASNKNVSCTRL